MSDTLPPDATTIVRQLDADALRERLDALDRERAALLTLLRAAQRMRRTAAVPESEVGRAR